LAFEIVAGVLGRLRVLPAHTKTADLAVVHQRISSDAGVSRSSSSPMEAYDRFPVNLKSAVTRSETR
jgi:hypothetical protein